MADDVFAAALPAADLSGFSSSLAFALALPALAKAPDIAYLGATPAFAWDFTFSSALPSSSLYFLLSFLTALSSCFLLICSSSL